VFNFSNCNYKGYRIGVQEGEYKVLLASDINGFNTKAKSYKTDKVASHGMADSLELSIGRLSGVMLKSIRNETKLT